MNVYHYIKNNYYRIFVPVFLLIIWQFIAQIGWMTSLFPSPVQVAKSLADWIFNIDGMAQDKSGKWIFDALNSTKRVFIGYFIAALSAIIIGISIGWSTVIQKTIEPTIQIFRFVPPVSWIPLAIIWFGIGDNPAVFLVFLGAFFPILINTIHGVRSLDINLIHAASMMGATTWQKIKFVVIPSALPSIFTGMRTSLGTAWMITVTAEMIAVKSGLGYALWDSYYFMRLDLVIAAMVSIGILGFLSDWVLKIIIRHVLHWQQDLLSNN